MSDNLSPPTLDLLCDELRQVVEWDQVAVSLKVSYVDIKSIETKYSELAQRKMHSLQKWLEQTNTVHSWHTVADAVEKVNPAVAENIRMKYATIIDQVTLTVQHEGCETNDDQCQTEKPIENEMQLEKNIVDDIINLENEFAMLVTKTHTSLERRPEILLPLLRYLKERGIHDKTSSEEAQCITYSRVFDILHTHWNYLKCRLLERIIHNFLSDTELPLKVQKYQDEIEAFKESTKMKDLADVVKAKQNTPGKKQVVLKIKEMWLDITLKRFEFLVKLLFQEYDESLQNIVVRKGSMHVTWSVSEEIALLIMRSKFDIELLKAIGVISLTVGTDVVFKNEDSQDDMTFDSALLRAVQSDGPLSAISLLLEVGGNPNLLTQSGETVISTVSKMKSIDGTTVLFVASQYGYLFAVSSLLSNGADPNVADNDGITPLIKASKNGHGDVVELLLETNVQIDTQDKNGITAISKASFYGHSSVVSILLNNGADPTLANINGWTPLIVASRNGHDDVVELLLEKNVPINTQEENGVTAISKASFIGHSSVVSMLLNNGADPNLADNNGWTPLMVAINFSHNDIVELLLEKNVLINTQDKNGATAISIAILKGHLSVVSMLLNNGADPNLADNNGCTPLMTASTYGHGDVVELLLENNVLINTQNKNGVTAISIASLKGHFSVVSILLNNGADPNLANNDGWTPLIIASLNGHDDVVELLLEKNVLINTQDKNGLTAIFTASFNGHSSVVSILLNNGADPNLGNNDGLTPLIIASLNGHGDVIEILLEKNVPINTQDKNGITAIYIASKEGHSSVVSILLDNGADPNLADNNGWTPLIAASRNGHGDVIEILLEKNVPINTQDKNGITSIHNASEKGHSSVVSILLDNGADPNLTDNNGWTPLIAASRNGHGDVIEILLEKNVPINTQDKNGITAIYIASKEGHSSVVSILLNNGADPNLTDNNGYTPLFVASLNGHGEVVELLLEKNVPINAKDKNGITAIYIASNNGHSSVVTILLNNGADPNIAAKYGLTPLIVASLNGHGDVVKLLLENNVLINTQNKNGVTAISIASLKGHFSVVSTLLNNGADPNLANNDGWTPLIIASLNGYDDVVELLLEKNVSINTQDKNGATAIYIACYKGHSSVVSILLNNGADPNHAANDGCTPLIVASLSGHSDVVKLLLENNVPINTQDKKGSTAIFLASINGHFSVVSILLNNGADPNLANNNGWTPLIIASLNGRGDVVELLLEKNVLINTQEKTGLTAISLASFNGHSSVVSMLISNGADPNLSDNNGWTPLIIASQNGHGDVIELLLENNVPINTQDKNGITAISIASCNGHSSVVSILLNNGADPNLPPNDGWTPLIVASRNGHGDVVKLLLENNVPINTQDKNGITAIYNASHSGHTSVVSILLNNGADPNLADKNGWTPLIVASRNGHGDVVKLLLENNVLINTQDKNGGTAIYNASHSGHTSVVSILLNNGADSNLANNDGMTPLIIASENGHGDVIELLLEKNVPINTQDKDGTTAIYNASHSGHSSVASILLNKGADPNLARTNGWTPLLIASAGGHNEVVRELLKTQVNINYQIPTGTTALYFSSYFGHENIVRQLLEGGADPLIRDLFGRSPLDIAHQQGHHNIALLLREAMAGLHDIDYQKSLAGSVESGYYTPSRLSTDHSSVPDSDIAQISDLEEEDDKSVSSSQQKKSREESEGEDSGVEILENKPYTEGPFGGGQYTYKVYHIGRHIPSWFRSVVPKTALEVHEESWNAYPYTKTKFSVPFVEKFLLEVDTVFRADAGTQENIFNLKPSELRERELDVIDIVNDSLSGSDYEEEEDPSLYQSLKTGRGPLTRDWIQNPPDGVIMCSYKLIKVGFRYWGLQSRVERFIHDYGLRRVMLRAHRQAWAWQDEWVGLTMDDIRKLELETKLILQSKLGRPMEEEERTDGDIQGGEDTMNEDLPKNDTRVSERVGSYRSRRRLSSRQHTSSIRSTGGGGTTSPPSELQIPKEKIDSDEEGSLYSYYALESIAIHEDSDTDTEYFDAKEIISEVDIEDSDQEFVDPEVGSHLSDFPHSLEENLDDLSADAEHCLYISISPLCSQDVLFLVVHSGTGFQFDDVNDKIDSQTLSGIFDEVFRTHYQFTIGRITIRFVPCPDISSSAYNLVSSLRPSPVALATQTFTPPYKNQFYDHTFPICTLPLIATEDPTYHNSLDQLVSSANSVYQTFLVSEEGRYFKGQVCLLADCIGSVMVYDILTRNTSDTFRSPSHSPAQSPSTTPTIMKRLGHKPISMSVPNDYQVHQSLGTPTRDAPRVLRIPSPTQEKRLPRFTRRSDAPLLFDVSKVFVFGSPLGLVLSLRRTRDGKMTTIRPQCESFYNLFYSADPLAFRLEPLLDPLFSSIPPLLIPSYHLYPTGDKSSSRLFETVSNYRHYFDSAHQLHPATLSNTKPNRGRRYASMECLIVGQYSEEEEDVRRKDTPPQGLRPFCVWWGDQRIDYQLQAPSGLEHGETLPVSNTAYAHIAQARYWEAKEMVSFVLRQVLQGGEGVPVLARSAGKQGFWVPFVPPTSTVKWAKKKTPLRIQKMSPNHRAVDIVVSTHSTHLPNLQAKFFYGPLNMAALSGEMVSIYILTSSDNKNEYNAGELKGATSAIDPVSMATETSPPKRSWHYLDTVSTDKHGRLNYNLSVEQCPFHPGLYPLIYLVKGDHTITCSNLFVLPPHTEAVVFSIDGALSSNFSLSGRDMKLKEDSIGITRLWQDLGYLIIYISGRPNMQKEYVTSWLGYHGFPLGVVSFADTLSTDSQNTKLLYLARLIKEAKVILSIAYGSQRHLTLYKELGLQPNQIYLYTKHSVKKAAGKAKDNCQLLTEDSGHFSELTANPPRPAAVDVTKIIGKLYFGYSETTVTSNFSKTKARSSSSPKVP